MHPLSLKLFLERLKSMVAYQQVRAMVGNIYLLIYFSFITGVLLAETGRCSKNENLQTSKISATDEGKYHFF